MSKTPEGSPGVKKNPENNPEKLSVLGRLGRVAAKAAGVIKDTLNTMIGRDSGEQAKDTSDTSDTIAPEAPVESDNTPAALIEPSKPTSLDIHIDEWGVLLGARLLNT